MRWCPTCAARALGPSSSATWRALSTARKAAHLGLPGAVGELLDRLPVAIAERKSIRAWTPADRAAGPLDEAHALHVLAPVEGRAEPQARDEVRDGDLGGGLAAGARSGSAPPPSCAPRRSARRDRCGPRRRGHVLARACWELHDERGVRRAAARSPRPPAALRCVAVGGAPSGAATRSLREPPGSRRARASACSAKPRAPDRQRRDGLERVQVAHELGAVEPLSLWRMSFTASACTRAFPASSREASLGSSR